MDLNYIVHHIPIYRELFHNEDSPFKNQTTKDVIIVM